MTLILASKSASRGAMLQAAGIAFEMRPANVDERAIESHLTGMPPGEIAAALAEAKALAADAGEGVVLGSDSLIVVNGQRYDKPRTRDEAAAHLRAFSGQTMDLHSAAAIVRAGEVVWRNASRARLHVRELSEAFIDQYLDAEWPEVAHCVGVFRIEGRGVQLFDRIEGDQFTILGMPLLPVLGALREQGLLAA